MPTIKDLNSITFVAIGKNSSNTIEVNLTTEMYKKAIDLQYLFTDIYINSIQIESAVVLINGYRDCTVFLVCKNKLIFKKFADNEIYEFLLS